MTQTFQPINPDHRADSLSNSVTYAANAEVRWVEQGHHAFFVAGPDRRFECVSDSRPGVRYQLQAEARSSHDGFVIHVSCSCPSGQNRDHLPIPCRHAAGIARRLVREGLAVLGPDMVYRLPTALQPPSKTACGKCGAEVEPTQAKDPLCGNCVFALFA